jgi:thiosulfate/3-mercaptopyruvate sulfurtransferase
MDTKLEKPVVSVDWLFHHLTDDNLIILDCTIPKVTANKSDSDTDDKQQIKGAIFFDIKTVFSDVNALFPNTVLTPKDFQQKAQNLGVNKNNIIVCYDDLGIYSSPRVWWMFQLMGFKNIAVLDGGFPEWKSKDYPIETKRKHQFMQGDFTVDYQSEKIKYSKDVLDNIKSENKVVLDARSNGRFFGTVPEPRKDLKGGHIPKSKSLPFSEIIKEGKFLSKEKLESIFSKINPQKKDVIFTCGSGITASILALGASIANINKTAVYDGSWTEWGSTADLPIEI